MRKVKKGEVILFATLALLLAYAAFACSTTWYKGIPADKFVSGTLESLIRPGEFHTNQSLSAFLLLAGVVWLVIFATYLLSRGNFMFGKEMGSARWSSPDTMNKHLKQKDNVILSRHVRMGLRHVPAAGRTWKAVKHSCHRGAWQRKNVDVRYAKSITGKLLLCSGRC